MKYKASYKNNEINITNSSIGEEYFQNYTQTQGENNITTDNLSMSTLYGEFINYNMPTGLKYDIRGGQYFYCSSGATKNIIHVSLNNNGADNVTLTGSTDSGGSISLVLYDENNVVISPTLYSIKGEVYQYDSSNTSVWRIEVENGKLISSFDLMNIKYLGGFSWGTDRQQYVEMPYNITLNDNVGDIRGEVLEGMTIDDKKPTLNGIAEPEVLIIVKDGYSVIGSVTSDLNGKWSFTPETSLSEGYHHLNVLAEKDGTLSEKSPYIDFIIDTNPPKISSIYDNVGIQTGSVGNNGKIDDDQPQVSGNANSNSVVTLYATDPQGIKHKLGSTLTNEEGFWIYQIESNQSLSDQFGTWTFTATEIDIDGNESSESKAYYVDFVDKNKDIIQVTGKEYFEYLTEQPTVDYTNGDKIETEFVTLTFYGALMRSQVMPTNLTYDPGGRQYFYIYEGSSNPTINIKINKGVSQNIVLTLSPSGETPDVKFNDAFGNLIPQEFVTATKQNYPNDASSEMWLFSVNKIYSVSSLDISNVVFFGGIEWGGTDHSALVSGKEYFEDITHSYNDGDLIETDLVKLNFSGDIMYSQLMPQELNYDAGGKQYFYLSNTENNPVIYIQIKGGSTSKISITATPYTTESPKITFYDESGNTIPTAYIVMKQDSYEYDSPGTGVWEYKSIADYTISSLKISNVIYFGGLEWE